MLHAKSLVVIYRFSNLVIPHFNDCFHVFVNLSLNAFIINSVMVCGIYSNG
jgi:hypothetical protein